MVVNQKSLIWSKVWYFEAFATSATLYPLLNLCFRRKGLTEKQIGIITALRPWMSAIAGNLWAGIGDKTGGHRTILLATYIGAIGLRYCLGLTQSFLMTLFLAIATEEGEYGKARMWGAAGWGVFSPLSGLLMNQYGAHVSFDANLVGGILGIIPTAHLPAKVLAQDYLPLQKEEDALSKENGSPKDARCESCATVQSSPVRACVGRTHSTLQSCEQQNPEKNNRILQNTGIKEDEAIFISHLANLQPITQIPELQDFDACSQLPYVAANNHANIPDLDGEILGTAESEGLSSGPGLWIKLQAIFSQGEVLVFFVQAVTFGFAAGIIDSYMFLYLDDIGAPEVLMGLTITVACLVELPVFHFMSSILDYVGVQPMLHWVLFFFLVRLGCYAAMGSFSSPWLVLPVETLNGITFGCAWAAGTVNCRRLAPRGLEATTQAIFSGLYMGFGLGLGGLFGGLVYHSYGPIATFAGAFVIVAGSWCCCISAQLILWWLKSRTVTELNF